MINTLNINTKQSLKGFEVIITAKSSRLGFEIERVMYTQITKGE
jgi:hypothetical protein